MDGIDDLDEDGRRLLAELATDPDSNCWRVFDALYYELVWRYLRMNHDKLASRVARYVGAGGAAAPQVLTEEVDEVAHEATTIALRRVRQRAARFDPDRGTSTMWVIGAAEYAWVEVAKTIVSARRSDDLVFTAPENLVDVPDPNPTTEEHVLRQFNDADALADAASYLTTNEFAAIRLRITLGYGHAEAAHHIFGDSSKTKQVDGLLTRGKAKLARAWDERRPTPRGAGPAKFTDSTADDRRSDA